jgi:uncharacterized protein
MSPTGRRLMGLTRTLHIYLTMLVCLLLLFFGATGFMLNHAEWFGLDVVRTATAHGQLPRDILEPVDKLAVVERLRCDYGAAGALDAFDTEQDGYRLVFKRPGSRCEATIRRSDGHLEMSFESRGTVALLTDLHKGASAGNGWKWVIDATSILLVVGSLTGLILWISLPRRRKLGLVALAVGLLSTALTYLLLVP